MKRISVGIIGCGKVAHIHAAALSSISEAHFSAVCDKDAGRAEAMGKRYNVPSFTDIGEMQKTAGIEAVLVCTPHKKHYAPTMDSLSSGMHVLVEKPLSVSLSECDGMINMAENTGLKLGVVKQRRFYEPVLRVRRAIDEGKLDKPVLGYIIVLGWRDRAYYESDPWRGTWKGEGGGVLVNQAVHQLDLLQWFMGPIDRVTAFCENLNHPYIEVEDTTVASIRFKSGALGAVIVSNSQKPGLYGKIHIHGKNGASVGVQTDGGSMFIAGMSGIQEPPVNDLWTIPGEEDHLEKWKSIDTEHFRSIDPELYYHGLQICEFLQAINEDRNPSVDGIEARKTVELFTAMYLSQETGRPVGFPIDTDNEANIP